MCSNNGTIIVLRKNAHAVFTQTNKKGFMKAGINDQKITYAGNPALGARMVKLLKADLNKELEFVEGFVGYSVVHITDTVTDIYVSCMDPELIQATDIIAGHEDGSYDD